MIARCGRPSPEALLSSWIEAFDASLEGSSGDDVAEAESDVMKELQDEAVETPAGWGTAGACRVPVVGIRLFARLAIFPAPCWRNGEFTGVEGEATSIFSIGRPLAMIFSSTGPLLSDEITGTAWSDFSPPDASSPFILIIACSLVAKSSTVYFDGIGLIDAACDGSSIGAACGGGSSSLLPLNAPITIAISRSMRGFGFRALGTKAGEM